MIGKPNPHYFWHSVWVELPDFRSLTAPAAVAWAAHPGWINLDRSPLAFMGSAWAVAIFTGLAMVEFVADQLPTTPSRTAPGRSFCPNDHGRIDRCIPWFGRRRNALGRRANWGGWRDRRCGCRLSSTHRVGPKSPRTGFSDRHSRGPGRNRARAPFGFLMHFCPSHAGGVTEQFVYGDG